MIHDATAQPDWDVRMMSLDQVSPIFVWNMFQKSSREDSNDVSKCEKKGGCCQLCCNFH